MVCSLKKYHKATYTSYIQTYIVQNDRQPAMPHSKLKFDDIIYFLWLNRKKIKKMVSINNKSNSI